MAEIDSMAEQISASDLDANGITATNQTKEMTACEKVFATCELLDQILMYTFYPLKKSGRYHQYTMASTLRLQEVNKTFYNQIHSSVSTVSKALYLAPAQKIDERYPWYKGDGVPNSFVSTSYWRINHWIVDPQREASCTKEFVRFKLRCSGLHGQVGSWRKFLLFQPPITKLWMTVRFQFTGEKPSVKHENILVSCRTGVTLGMAWEAAKDLVAQLGVRRCECAVFAACINENGILRAPRAEDERLFYAA